MIEYHVYQEALYRDRYYLEIYRGTSTSDAARAIKYSIQSLNNSAVGHRWRTRIKVRDVSRWSDIDISEVIR